MMLRTGSLWLGVSLLLLHAVPVPGIHCFECDSSSNFSCTESWDPTTMVISRYLSDCSHVFQATHCIKMTGVFNGKLGTRRFCSSKTWGNYCEYIRRPGDIQEYRSCVISCSTHGCNQGTITPALPMMALVILSLLPLL